MGFPDYFGLKVVNKTLFKIQPRGVRPIISNSNEHNASGATLQIDFLQPPWT